MMENAPPYHDGRYGQNGFELFRRERPHITILDFAVPNMDGLTVFREIRAVDSTAAVSMLTSVGPDAQEKQARALGITKFLAKEFSLHELGRHSILSCSHTDRDRSKSARHG